MKKLLLFLFCQMAFADPTLAITANFSPTKEKAYYVLSDGSIWEVYPFITRYRSCVEWICGTELYVPENYSTIPSDWPVGTELEMVPKNEHLRVNQEDASNAAELYACSHLIADPKTEKILFARYLPLDEFIAQIYDDGHKKGYKAGHSDGYFSGYAAGNTQGYYTGYAAGRAVQ
jgi:hypothetical protein